MCKIILSYLSVSLSLQSEHEWTLLFVTVIADIANHFKTTITTFAEVTAILSSSDDPATTSFSLQNNLTLLPIEFRNWLSRWRINKGAIHFLYRICKLTLWCVLYLIYLTVHSAIWRLERNTPFSTVYLEPYLVYTSIHNHNFTYQLRKATLNTVRQIRKTLLKS